MTLILLAMAELAAIAAVGVTGLPGWFGGLVVLVALPAVWALHGRRAAAWSVVAAALALAGGMRFAAWDAQPLPPLAAFVGQPVAFDGVIASEPDPGLTTVRYRIDAQTMLDGRAIRGAVLVTLDQYAEHGPGERVRIRGTIDPAPSFEGFDYRAYLERRGIVGTMSRPRVETLAKAPAGARTALWRLRSALDEATQRALPEPEASLASGIAFGRDATIPPGLYDDFRATGLAHIVAVSGSNVVLLAALAFNVCVPLLGRRWAVLPAVVLVMLYAVVAGASGSVVRAGVMAGVLLFGRWAGRPESALPALAATAIVLTLGWPALAADAGFQLSLAATAGIIVLSPWFDWAIGAGLRRARLGAWVPGTAVEALALTLAATVATLPISAATFGRISLIGPVANVIGAPLFVVVLPLAALTASAGMVSEQAGWATGLAAYYPLAAIVRVAETLAAVPGASVPMPAHSPALATLVAVLLCTAGGWAYRSLPPERMPEPFHRRAKLPAGATAFAAGLGIVWLVSLRPAGGPGVLRLDVLDVGQGDAILVTTPAGRRVLVDAGPSGIGLARELGAVMPHWARRIDLTLVTHADGDHSGGFPAVFRRFDTGRRMEGDVAGAVTFATEAGEREPWRVHRGDRWELDGVRFEVLWPPAGFAAPGDNDGSIVLRVTYGQTSALLTADIEARAQDELLRAGDVHADVLKVPHHGSKSSSPAFLAAAGARIAVISVGAENRYGHPAGEVLDALAASTIARTDRDGRVRIESDGRRLRLRTGR
ncbi:MAG: ComEC/Rec2 family competence protein [Dehalococcoidia bacterium]|nr:ComEC/Rec2 family competence protein [Dehalococcoidia bacterium]